MQIVLGTQYSLSKIAQEIKKKQKHWYILTKQHFMYSHVQTD